MFLVLSLICCKFAADKFAAFELYFCDEVVSINFSDDILIANSFTALTSEGVTRRIEKELHCGFYLIFKRIADQYDRHF